MALLQKVPLISPSRQIPSSQLLMSRLMQAGRQAGISISIEQQQIQEDPTKSKYF
jgi:hypothetical protein